MLPNRARNTNSATIAHLLKELRSAKRMVKQVQNDIKEQKKQEKATARIVKHKAAKAVELEMLQKNDFPEKGDADLDAELDDDLAHDHDVATGIDGFMDEDRDDPNPSSSSKSKPMKKGRVSKK
jgi:hypothetical protein